MTYKKHLPVETVPSEGLSPPPSGYFLHDGTKIGNDLAPSKRAERARRDSGAAPELTRACPGRYFLFTY